MESTSDVEDVSVKVLNCTAFGGDKLASFLSSHVQPVSSLGLADSAAVPSGALRVEAKPGRVESCVH